MKQHEPLELDWLAFCYVADELLERERLEFERRLGEDQAAREAVARAVELGQTLAAVREIDQIAARGSASTERAAAQRTNWLQPAGWMGVGASLACLVVVALLSFGPSLWPGQAERGSPRTGLKPGVKAAENESTLELAQAWSTARTNLADDNDTWWAEMLAQVEQGFVETRLIPSAEEQVDEAADVPSWMMSAVASEASPGESTPDTNETQEN